MHILTEAQERLLKDERNLLTELRLALVQTGTAPEDQKTLAESIRQLEEIFLLVIVGEFNAGKSAFINALLGQKLLKEGVTPTTTEINVLRYGAETSRRVIDQNLHEIALPADLLREISIVDTPGTNAIIREHEEITSEYVPRSDLVIFLTSADRPFTESESAFMGRIRDWGKKVVIVINKIDIFQSHEDMNQVIDFVSDHARTLLGSKPEVFPISARLALRAKQGEPGVWEESKFGALEAYIVETLDEKGRIQLKLKNPLGVGRHLVNRYLEVTNSRLALLHSDVSMLSDVDAQMKIYHDDMLRDFRFRMSDIENILFEMEKRGDEFFDETFRLARVMDLLSKDRVRREFEQVVVADVPQRVERKLGELIDWLVEANLHQWQGVNEHLSERRRQHAERIVGDSAIGTFHYDRERLMDAVGQEARHVVEDYDKEAESRLIAEGAQEAVATSAALEVGALGLGALVTILATSVAGDVTGILLASVIAALGLFVIPTRRRQGKAEMRSKIAEMRTQLAGSLQKQFEHEITRSMGEINEAISPYTRFVRAEQQKLDDTRAQLEKISDGMDRLRGEIERL